MRIRLPGELVSCCLFFFRLSYSGKAVQAFTDPLLCAVIVDRLTFNGVIIETGTDSYRLASARARAEEPVGAG